MAQQFLSGMQQQNPQNGGGGNNNNNLGNLFQQMMPMAQQFLSGMQQQNPQNGGGGNNNNNFGNLFQQMMPMAQQFLSGMQQQNPQSHPSTNPTSQVKITNDDIDDISPPSSPEDMSPPSSPEISPQTSPQPKRNSPPSNSSSSINVNNLPNHSNHSTVVTTTQPPKPNSYVPTIHLNLKSGFNFPTVQDDYSCIFLTHSTIDEGMKINSGWKFNKVWNVKNNGNKNWSEGTTLQFIQGNNLQLNEAKVPLLTPNEEGKISVAMQAPAENGRFIGYYQLKNSYGLFGTRFWVHIFVNG
eukprot:TRINITY_DN444_c0_g1_i1.p1 TRINITY_DN444_c0_g1~~TRINITY_DN444_c0_g1_i1.p1  ORF type:complete len:298 (-),score=89.04 TRINITY_DN444_c0_g1_i1:48-941(-)